MPIYDVTMVRTVKEPINILRRDGIHRYYLGGNNHHVEILQEAKTSEWTGVCVDMFTAAMRVKPPRKQKRQPIVQHDHGPEKRCIMSLSEGETVFMKSPPMKRTKTEEYDYFVVAKIDENNIHFAHHTDARPATAKKNPKTGETEEPSERIALSARQLQKLTLPSGEPPKKVRIKVPAYKDAPDSVQALTND